MLPPDTPLWAVPVLGLVATFLYFAVVIALRDHLIKLFGRDNKIARAIAFVFGGRFLWQDVVANYVCFAPIVWHLPNQYGEGRTITAHANVLIKLGLRANQHDALHGLDKWRFKFSVLICKQLGKIDEGHCSALKDIK